MESQVVLLLELYAPRNSNGSGDVLVRRLMQFSCRSFFALCYSSLRIFSILPARPSSMSVRVRIVVVVRIRTCSYVLFTLASKHNLPVINCQQWGEHQFGAMPSAFIVALRCVDVQLMPVRWPNRQMQHLLPVSSAAPFSTRKQHDCFVSVCFTWHKSPTIHRALHSWSYLS